MRKVGGSTLSFIFPIKAATACLINLIISLISLMNNNNNNNMSSSSDSDHEVALSRQILDQIHSVFLSAAASSSSSSLAAETVRASVEKRGRVIVHGVGREGLMMKGLCMRLGHLAITSHCVGDMNTPPISTSDLLIASAGPGGFPTVDALISTAKRVGATVAVITAQPHGSAAVIADKVLLLPAQTMAADDDHHDNDKKKEEVEEEMKEEEGDYNYEDLQLLPMGSLYEGSMFVLFEMVVYRLAIALRQTPQAIRARHTNLE